jgi:hypothetical protein
MLPGENRCYTRRHYNINIYIVYTYHVITRSETAKNSIYNNNNNNICVKCGEHQSLTHSRTTAILYEMGHYVFF